LELNYYLGGKKGKNKERREEGRKKRGYRGTGEG